jgi:two-component system sensor kinase
MAKQRILVVEDHKLLLQAIRDLLESQGYEVYLALNGVEALDIMQDVTPDLILSDIMMPQMDGYTFYEKVRENPKWVRIPFIFLTARGQHEDIKRGKALGVEDYLTKPFDTEEVAIAVRSRLERADAIQQATEREFDELKQDIVNVLSHELRTPLTYIAGYTELALEDASDLSPDELVTFLQGIKKGTNRLHGLVEDMLIGVQIDTRRSQQEYERFASVNSDLREIIHSTVQNYEHLAAEQQVTLEEELPEGLPPVELYQPFLEEALGRIIENGIKFSKKPPRRVLVKAESKDDKVHIRVMDKGPGISEEQQSYIFHRLQQLNRQEMEQQGTGMGLFIANAYVDMHGGEITVESEPGEGSTFTITLPVVQDV